jgi:hypothetical protein
MARVVNESVACHYVIPVHEHGDAMRGIIVIGTTMIINIRDVGTTVIINLYIYKYIVFCME